MTFDNRIHAHPHFKLGKRETVRDARTLRFRDFVRGLLATPRQYDFDLAHPGISTPMFANDRHGNCVIAARAHQTLRFELMEQDKGATISDQDVLREYFAETGGVDEGLDPLASLKAWRNEGWFVEERLHFIRAFAEIDPRIHEYLRQAVYMDLGVGMGLELPLTAQVQVQTGRPWDVVVAAGKNTAPGSWGGHFVHISGYTAAGPVCVTWGRKQQMTWAFVDRYCDEAYAVLDAKQNAKAAAALNFYRLDALLHEVSPKHGMKS